MDNAVAPGHQLTQAALPLSRQMIEQHRFIVVRDSSRNQAPQSHRVFSKRPVLSVPSSVAEKINALRAGLGVGFLPAHRIQELLKQGLLIALPIEDTIPIETRATWPGKQPIKAKSCAGLSSSCLNMISFK
ncbi:MAG: LysR substrate-binding domain-containing protein [Methylobacter sp.]